MDLLQKLSLTVLYFVFSKSSSFNIHSYHSLQANDPNDPQDAKWQWNLIGGGFGRGGRGGGPRGRGGRGGPGGRGGRGKRSIPDLELENASDVEDLNEEGSVELQMRQRGGGRGRGRGGRGGRGGGRGGGPRFMLNTDMELAYDIDVDDLEGTSCSINENAPGPGRPEGPNGPDGPGGPGGPGGRGGGGRGRGGRGGGPGGPRGGRGGGRGGPGGRGGRGGRGRRSLDIFKTRQNEGICPDAATKSLVEQYCQVSESRMVFLCIKNVRLQTETCATCSNNSCNLLFQNEALFLADFKAVYEKMMERGDFDLTVPA